MIRYEMDHWVLFDTLSNDQVSRLKNVIDKKTTAAASTTATAAESNGSSFLSMLEAETAKLNGK